jgi:hypothetical protein
MDMSQPWGSEKVVLESLKYQRLENTRSYISVHGKMQVTGCRRRWSVVVEGLVEDYPKRIRQL